MRRECLYNYVENSETLFTLNEIACNTHLSMSGMAAKVINEILSNASGDLYDRSA